MLILAYFRKPQHCCANEWNAQETRIHEDALMGF